MSPTINNKHSNVYNASPHQRCFHSHQPCILCLTPLYLLPVQMFFYTFEIKVKVRDYFAWHRQAGLRQWGGRVPPRQNRPEKVDWLYQDLFTLREAPLGIRSPPFGHCPNNDYPPPPSLKRALWGTSSLNKCPKPPWQGFRVPKIKHILP